ncbi:AmmeMemoRadiSam system protein A [Ruminococcus albus]|uniref:Uncharacterized protein, PH0010 family/AmmeMemoRadiSam system protein A/AmmeMemoRadiSam system protein B n=1 Tax=Ruminococcus albus TaxID=1264 RepID=A0A1I1QD27_RUMAL|nr:AmmeMemoRadiSam system protein A [Ruminococcus albus]SFD19991.1 uncharacterized protein, PH0010 family/AmmeMemoRadiSam system protein A/AmmeMemoRadiSam system protein B [Ruminococcus albus]
MPIVAAFIVPHPPLIVPAVGRGGEREVQKTIDSYLQTAEEIAALKPETIIISSPHAVMYRDYFHISPGEKAFGTFVDFRAPEVSFAETYDTELVAEIERIAREKNFPAGTMGEKDPRLDHGTMVPLYFTEQRYTAFKLVRIGLSGLPLTKHYELGKIIAKAVENTNRRVVWIASGDLSHKLQEYGPYGYAEEGPIYDEKLIDTCVRGALGELKDFDEDLCERAAECGHRSFTMMSGAFDGVRVRSKVYSHEDVTGVGYGVCSFYPKNNGDEFVSLARMTIETYIKERKRIMPPTGLSEKLTSTRAGAFVSIHKKGDLRGCIGTIAPCEDSLAEEIISNAISASTRDPRFPPITTAELDSLEINVDVLTEPIQVKSLDELDPKRYGVIVQSGYKRGLLLPDLEGIDSVEQQLDIAMMKGGITYEDELTVFKFEVVRHK